MAGEVEAANGQSRAKGPSLPGRLGGLVTRRISAKIVVPYLVIIVLLAMLGTFVVMRLVAGSLEERLVNQLLDAGRKANDTVVTLEEEHLRIFRAMAFTEGVDKAMAAGDDQYMMRVLRPIQFNSRVPYVEVISKDGRHLLSLAFKDNEVKTGPTEPGIRDWEIVRKVLSREQDEMGDKYSALISTPQGMIFYTAGPVRTSQDEIVGAVLIGTSLDEFLTRLSRSALAAVSIYGSKGDLIGTTLPYKALTEGAAVSPESYQSLFSSPTLVFGRRVQVGVREYDELLGRLEVRRKTAAVIGVAYPAGYIFQASFLSRNQLIVLFSIAVFGVLVVGLMLARQITRPLRTLVDAARAVAMGDLDRTVPPTTEDETGVLTRAFNEMVVGLKDRERVKDTFGKYMTREVSDFLLRGEIKLGGEERDITVLMSDIRSFTTLSEGMDPEELVAFLNRYFAGQVEAVSMYKGRVDKFMGDAILAVYGAPIPYEDHALRGVLSALKMREKLAEFNRELEAAGVNPVRIGIGVNTGPAVVGNIGSEQRLEYTIIGDTVNATQRIEDLTKEFKWDILISDSTFEHVAHVIEVGEPHYITLRGRTQETAIYPVIGLKKDAHDHIPKAEALVGEEIPSTLN